ncbi:hypothetical protein GGI24_001187 [Coemansia furcata]|nr:hypothetical protein GGI24_001187 [Coemansia furcata]
MKFTVVLALAAAVAAQAPPNLEAIMAAMPLDLVAAMTYFPPSFVQGILGGAALPTDVNVLFSMAPKIPMGDRPKLESEYLQFLSQIAPLMPTPTQPTSASSPSSTPKTTSTETSSAKPSSSDAPHSGHSSESSNSGHSSDSVKESNSANSESDSVSHSDSHSGDSHSESDSGSNSDSDSSSKKNGAAKVAVSFVAVVALAAGAMF